MLDVVARAVHDPGFWTSAGIAAFVAAGVALVVGVASVLIQLKVANDARNDRRRETGASFRLRQLNEFYEPLAMLRIKSRYLRKSIPETEPDGSRWRLVNHIDEVKADEGRSRIVEEILDINDQIQQLLINKAGLMEGETPKSFEKFMHHSALLKLAWLHRGELIDDSEPNVTHVADVPFPDRLDADIQTQKSAVQSALAAVYK